MSRSTTERPGALRGRGALRMAPCHGALRIPTERLKIPHGFFVGVICIHFRVQSNATLYCYHAFSSKKCPITTVFTPREIYLLRSTCNLEKSSAAAAAWGDF